MAWQNLVTKNMPIRLPFIAQYINYSIVDTNTYFPTVILLELHL